LRDRVDRPGAVMADAPTGPRLRWLNICLLLCAGWLLEALVLAALLLGPVPEDRVGWAVGSYVSLLVLLCVGALWAWPQSPELPGLPEAKNMQSTMNLNLIVMPWSKFLGFILFAGWAPTLLADGAVRRGLIRAGPKVLAWLSHSKTFLLDISLCTVWEGAAEYAGIAGNLPVSKAPVTSWVGAIFLLFTALVAVGGYSCTQLLPGVPLSAEYSLDLLPRVVYRIVIALWLGCYVQVMATSPGYRSDFNLKLLEVDRSELFTCEICKDRRPHRCHHCTRCGTCVLRMDHHCPWLHKCVGYRNYKYFLLFIVYTMALAIFQSATVVPYVAGLFQTELPFWTRVCLVFHATAISFLALILIGFVAFHFYLMSNALSTIEWLARRRVRNAVSKYDYSQGVYKNLQATLGANPVFWLLPVFPPDGSGVTFPHVTVGKDGGAVATPGWKTGEQVTVSQCETSYSRLGEAAAEPPPEDRHGTPAQGGGSYTRLGQKERRRPARTRSARRNSQQIPARLGESLAPLDGPSDLEDLGDCIDMDASEEEAEAPRSYQPAISSVKGQWNGQVVVV